MDEWTALTKDELEKLYWVDCLSTADLAKRFNRDSETVRHRMISLNIRRREAGKSRTFNPTRAELHDAYQKYSMRQIARMNEVGETVVWKRLKEHGIKLAEHEDGGHRKKPGRKFSSEHREALSKAHRERDNAGDKNPNWRGGTAVPNWKARQTPDYRRWRLASLERAGGKCEGCGALQGSVCECCGTKLRLHVHHLRSFAAFPDLRFDPKNSEVVCPRCHKLRHDGKIG